MWTIENLPLDYFEQEYKFRPTDDWLEKVRKSSLRFGKGCSASFVSADGLIMTNHHCVRSILPRLNEEDEEISRKILIFLHRLTLQVQTISLAEIQEVL